MSVRSSTEAAAVSLLDVDLLEDERQSLACIVEALDGATAYYQFGGTARQDSPALTLPVRDAQELLQLASRLLTGVTSSAALERKEQLRRALPNHVRLGRSLGDIVAAAQQQLRSGVGAGLRGKPDSPAFALPVPLPPPLTAYGALEQLLFTATSRRAADSQSIWSCLARVLAWKSEMIQAEAPLGTRGRWVHLPQADRPLHPVAPYVPDPVDSGGVTGDMATRADLELGMLKLTALRTLLDLVGLCLGQDSSCGRAGVTVAQRALLAALAQHRLLELLWDTALVPQSTPLAGRGSVGGGLQPDRSPSASQLSTSSTATATEAAEGVLAHVKLQQRHAAVGVLLALCGSVAEEAKGGQAVATVLPWVMGDVAYGATCSALLLEPHPGLQRALLRLVAAFVNFYVGTVDASWEQCLWNNHYGVRGGVGVTGEALDGHRTVPLSPRLARLSMGPPPQHPRGCDGGSGRPDSTGNTSAASRAVSMRQAVYASVPRLLKLLAREQTCQPLQLDLLALLQVLVSDLLAEVDMAMRVPSAADQPRTTRPGSSTLLLRAPSHSVDLRGGYEGTRRGANHEGEVGADGAGAPLFRMLVESAAALLSRLTVMPSSAAASRAVVNPEHLTLLAACPDDATVREAATRRSELLRHLLRLLLELLQGVDDFFARFDGCRATPSRHHVWKAMADARVVVLESLVHYPVWAALVQLALGPEDVGVHDVTCGAGAGAAAAAAPSCAQLAAHCLRLAVSLSPASLEVPLRLAPYLGGLLQAALSTFAATRSSSGASTADDATVWSGGGATATTSRGSRSASVGTGGVRPVERGASSVLAAVLGVCLLYSPPAREALEDVLQHISASAAERDFISQTLLKQLDRVQGAPWMQRWVLWDSTGWGTGSDVFQLPQQRLEGRAAAMLAVGGEPCRGPGAAWERLRGVLADALRRPVPVAPRPDEAGDSPDEATPSRETSHSRDVSRERSPTLLVHSAAPPTAVTAPRSRPTSPTIAADGASRAGIREHHVNLAHLREMRARKDTLVAYVDALQPADESAGTLPRARPTPGDGVRPRSVSRSTDGDTNESGALLPVPSLASMLLHSAADEEAEWQRALRAALGLFTKLASRYYRSTSAASTVRERLDAYGPSAVPDLFAFLDGPKAEQASPQRTQHTPPVSVCRPQRSNPFAPPQAPAHQQHMLRAWTVDATRADDLFLFHLLVPFPAGTNEVEAPAAVTLSSQLAAVLARLAAHRRALQKRYKLVNHSLHDVAVEPSGPVGRLGIPRAAPHRGKSAREYRWFLRDVTTVILPRLSALFRQLLLWIDAHGDPVVCGAVACSPYVKPKPHHYRHIREQLQRLQPAAASTEPTTGAMLRSNLSAVATGQDHHYGVIDGENLVDVVHFLSVYLTRNRDGPPPPSSSRAPVLPQVLLPGHRPPLPSKRLQLVPGSDSPTSDVAFR